MDQSHIVLNWLILFHFLFLTGLESLNKNVKSSRKIAQPLDNIFTNEAIVDDGNNVNNAVDKEKTIYKRVNDVYLYEILRCMKEMRQNFYDKKKDDAILDEWKCVAKIIDRTMFWVGFLVLGIYVPMMLLIRDDSHH